MPPSRNNAFQDVIEYLFDPASRAEAMRLLVRGCGGELASERIRLAVLRLSNGDLDELRSAITLARTDWRDALVAAGFGDSVTAHTKWLRQVREAAALTAAGWGSCTDPLLMLTALHRKAGTKKLRLFAAACVRRALPRLPAEERKPERVARVRNAVEILDRFLNGEATREGLNAAGLRAIAGGVALAVVQALRACKQTGVLSEATVSGVAQQALAGCPPKQRLTERTTQAALLRCLFGNPFCPLPARTFPTHVVGLAESVAAAFPAVSADYAILADALEELGEGPAAAHCRQGTHARGCHVVDWILQRS
jgi:hypothetical protein